MLEVETVVEMEKVVEAVEEVVEVEKVVEVVEEVVEVVEEDSL